MTGSQIAAAIAAFTPIVRALIIEAEQTGKSGSEKHAAVAEGSEQIYRALQGAGGIREIRGIPWEAIAPIIVPVTGGLISIVVGIFNKLFGPIWDFITGDDNGE